MTNNFYDKSETYSLPLKELVVDGEIANPGPVDFTSLHKRSVIVKEALPENNGSNRFTGAFRYDGYSLFDILDRRIIKKVNAAEYNSVIDLFLVIENDKGEKTVFSWGDIYYPGNLHKVIIASDVSRIVPSKTKELWELPVDSKIVAANDLITVRNISGPVKITVRSYPLSMKMNRGMSPMYSPVIKILENSRKIGEIDRIPGHLRKERFEVIFYGRGRGIHSTTPFTGLLVKEVLGNFFPVNPEKIRTGMLCFAGLDGYRCAVSFSELFNRNDQQEFLLVNMNKNQDGGEWRMFAACDFFSDRAVKSLSEIHLSF